MPGRPGRQRWDALLTVGLVAGVVAGCGGASAHGSRTTITARPSTRASRSTTSTAAGAQRSSTATPSQTTPRAQTSTSSSTTAGGSSTPGTTTRAPTGPSSQPHFLVKLKLSSDGTLTPPSVAVAGGFTVALAVTNAGARAHTLAIAQATKSLFSESVPADSTKTAVLPTLKNAAYTVRVDNAPRGVLLIGAKAGP